MEQQIGRERERGRSSPPSSKEGWTDGEAREDGREASFECGRRGTMSKSRLRLTPSESSSNADNETMEGFFKAASSEKS